MHTAKLNSPFRLYGMLCIGTVLGILGADFTSGLIHWTLDSWGSIGIPVVGEMS